MAQRVDYEQIPGTRFDQYIFKLRLVLGYLNQPGGNKFKGFRDFLRKQNLWDKDKSESLFSLVDLTWDKSTVKVGKTAKKLLGAHSDNDFQNVLFERLKEVNILLVKYVLEALDVTQGGRLHSVHELYRMITSYVYPGAYITLVAFQAWIEWLAASGYIKLVGIRWALSDKGQKVVAELRQMDVDEIMEDLDDEADADEADAGADEGGGDDDDDDGPTPAAPPARAPQQAAATPVAPSKFAKPPLPQPSAKPAAKAASSDDIDDEEDLFADLPPEPEAPDEDTIKAASARLGLDEDEDGDEAPPPPKPSAPKYTPPASLAAKPKADKAAAAAGPSAPAAKPGASKGAGASAAAASPGVSFAAAPASLHAPLAVTATFVVPASALAGTDQSALVERVVGFHQALGEWPSFTAGALGIAVQAGAGDLPVLIELGVIAALIEGLEPQPQVFAFVKRVRETPFFASLGHGEGFEEGLDALERLAQEPWARPLFERLVHARGIAKKVGNKIDLLYQLRQASSGREVVALLREHVTGPHFVEAPFWVARELVRLGLLKDAHLKSALAVPTRRLVANAARIGLTRVSELRDLESLTTLSEAVTALFGNADAGYGEALANLDRGLGLTIS